MSAQQTSLRYADLARPSRDSATLHRSAARAMAAHRQPHPSTRAADSAAYVAECLAAAPPSSLDTWSGFLAGQWSETVKSGPLEAGASPTAAPAAPSSADLVSALQGVVARQNRVVAQLQERLMAQRAREEKDWERAKQSAVEGGKGKKAASAAAAASSAEAAPNTAVCVVLSRVLEKARREWAAAVSQHFAAAAERKARTSTTATNTGADSSTASPAAVINAEAAMEEERVGMAPIALLLRCLVDGVNSSEAQEAIIEASVLTPSAWESGVLGVDQLGLLTVFQRHVQALRTYPGIVPPLEALREYFAELHPSRLTTTYPCGPLDSTLELAEAQTDAFLRLGEEAEQIAAILREGLHPSVRRLFYARALQVPLAVTDGKPLFPAQGELMTNQTRHGLARYLTCASKPARDKLKRRFHHHYSSVKQENRARLLQRLALDDMFMSVGDSDKYFVYTDDVEVLATALVVDRSLPDPKLLQTLRQLGRPEGQFESYMTYLLYPERDLILQKAPPCGFAPVEGFTLLQGAVCNITGDTVEQYELVSAMMAQLWSRLQGPTPELFQCCLIFESLVQRLALPAVLHATRDLQYPPLVLAMRWMLTGFAELLDAFEVLSFWDLVLSYHVREMHRRSPLSSPAGLAAAAPPHDMMTPCALWLLPMYAAAIFVMRAPLVEACRSAAEVDVVFATGHHLRTRSLLQAILFAGL